MRFSEPELVKDNLYFPECLRWREGRLWFSDMFAGTVYHSSGEAGDAPVSALEVDDEVAGLGWLPGGDLLAVSMNKRKVLRLAGDEVVTHADLSAHFEYPINDMYVTAAGRAYVTGFGFDADHGAPIESVQLAVVETDGTADVTGSPMIFPNGIDSWNDDQGVLVAETYANILSFVPVDPTGRPQASRRFAALADDDGPDGISCDDEGGVWVACAFGHRAVHLDRNGTIDAEVPVPGLGVFDCLLAGPEGRTLYLGVSGPDEQYGRLHRTGSILSVELRP